MFHGKLMLIDNELTVIGTTNFTSRSFNINDEMNLYIHGGTIVSEVNEALAQDFHDSKRNDERVFEKLSFGSVVRRNLRDGLIFICDDKGRKGV